MNKNFSILNILYIEDDTEDIDLFEEIITLLGHKIISFTDHNKALNTIRDNKKLDLIFVDYQLNGITGTKVAEIIKTITPNIPILLITSEDDFCSFTSIVKEIHDNHLNVIGFIPKSINMDADIESWIEKVIGNKQDSAQGATTFFTWKA